MDRALFAVVMDAHPYGVLARKVDDLVTAIGAETGISKSEVARICSEVEADIAVFRDRALDATGYPYVFLDATYRKAMLGERVLSQALVLAIGVAADGRREVLGFVVGDSENEGFWTMFPRSLKTQGLGGVALVISDAYAGPKRAIGTVFQGACWHRCRVHIMGNLLAVVPKGQQEMMASLVRTVFSQPDPAPVGTQLAEVNRMLVSSHPPAAALLEDAREDVLDFTAFPAAHWRRVWSTNPIERVNKEIKRRTDVGGIFPNSAALLLLAGAVLIEQHEKWEAGDRRYLSQASMAELTKQVKEVGIPVIEAAWTLTR